MKKLLKLETIQYPKISIELLEISMNESFTY